MEFRQLQYTVQIALERSFSRAAEKLHIAQPSLSQQIAKLEKEIDIILFQRSTSHVELTQAGELFVKKSQVILDLVEQLKQEMEDISQIKKGRLVVGSMPMTGATILPRVVPAFQTAYPEIEITLIEETSSHLETITSQGQTDISLLSLPLRVNGLNYEVLLQEEIVLAVPPHHPLAQSQNAISLAMLAQEAFISLKKGLGFQQLTLDLCIEAGFMPQIVFESSNMETIQSLVAAGMGIAFVPYFIAERNDSSYAPVYLQIDTRPTRTLVMAYKKGRYMSKAAEAFMQTMKKVADALSTTRNR